MSDIGVYTPETAKLVLEVVRYLKANGFVIEPGGRKPQFVPPDAPVYIRNDSGLVVPPFACCQVTGTVDVGGQNYLTIDQPADVTGEGGWYVFNGIAEIEAAADSYGIAYDGPLVRMLTDGSTITAGDRWQPMVDAWTVEPGGSLFIAAGADDIEDDVMRAFVATGGSGEGGSVIAVANSGIAARSGTTPGSASCTEYKVVSGSLVTNTNTFTVLNISLFAIPSGAFIVANKERISGQWVTQAVINGLRYQSPNLQYSIDGSTWVTFATATTSCPP